MLTCRFDYLRGTLRFFDFEDLTDLLSSLDPAWGWTERSFWSGKPYQRGFKSVLGRLSRTCGDKKSL